MLSVRVISTCNRTNYFLSKKEERLILQKQEKWSFRFDHYLASPLLAAALTLSTPSFIAPPASFGKPISSGAALFQKACIGCHDMGGNILQPGATLFTKDLERNGVAKEEELYNITYYGKGRMPGFGERCSPRGQCTFGPRLQDDEIKRLVDFVKLQAEKGWPSVTYGD